MNNTNILEMHLIRTRIYTVNYFLVCNLEEVLIFWALIMEHYLTHKQSIDLSYRFHRVSEICVISKIVIIPSPYFIIKIRPTLLMKHLFDLANKHPSPVL
jgi:hypothetical protein